VSLVDASRLDRPRLILLAPIRPAAGGNGLAMRCELFRRAAATRFEVCTVVVPVAGSLPAGACLAPADVTVAMDPDRARVGLSTLLANPVWRERLTVAGALPHPARAASPGLSVAVVDALPADRFAALHAMRSYLAPLAVAVAEELEIGVLTLDLDEDDAAFAANFSEADASAYQRLVESFGGRFDGVSASSAVDARSLAARHGLTVDYVPNAVEIPPGAQRSRATGGRRDVSLLFVGNLTYPPNVEAAERLVHDILPAVRRALDRPVMVSLVGEHHPHLARLAGPDVLLTGFVTDLGPVYAVADVVVVALASGAGTRIKLLEAFAHGVPVVASPVAAAGLEVTGGRHLLLAEDAEQVAAAVAAVVEDDGLAARLAQEAGRLVHERYSTSAVIPAIAQFLRRAERRAEAALQDARSG
jgi:glycosyltransferase involved in cell wall biosynthesis